MKKIRLAGTVKTNRLRGGLLILTALMLSANSLFAAVTSISQLDSAKAFSFAAISDTRADTDQDCGRAFGWIEQYHDFVFEVGDVYDGNVTSNNTYQAKWRTTWRKNNTYPCFGNHCSKIDGGDQYRWGIPYFALTNLNQTGWTFRATNSTLIKAYKSKADEAAKVYTYFPDRKIDYYAERAIAGFNVHIITIYKQDHSVFDVRSGSFLNSRMEALVAAGKTKHDIIIVQGHSERWLWQSKDEMFAGNPVALTTNQVKFIDKNADIVLSASDHRFRRIADFDAWNQANGALHIDTGIANGSSTMNGYCEFHVFDGTNPKITMQYINSHITTRKLHVGRANDGAINTNGAPERHESLNDLHPALKVVNGGITQPLDWSTFTVTAPTTVVVPWVTNLTQAVAGTTITNAGLVVSGVSSEHHATVPAGKIFSQTPGGGTTVASGSSVALAVSLGPVTTSTTVPFISIGAHDGYVDESSETSNVGGSMSATLTSGTAIRVGDTGARKQRKGFVSFDCSALPDNCTIISATLKLKRGGGVGTPTSLGTLVADVKNVNTGWSDNSALQSTDFQGPASASSVVTLSYPSATGAWATGNLNATGLIKINKTTASYTQYRIRFTTDDDNDTADDYLGFYSGENATAANRPVLEVTYQ